MRPKASLCPSSWGLVPPWWLGWVRFVLVWLDGSSGYPFFVSFSVFLRGI